MRKREAALASVGRSSELRSRPEPVSTEKAPASSIPASFNPVTGAYGKRKPVKEGAPCSVSCPSVL